MYCSKCGQYSDGSEKFCASCGTPLAVANNNNEVQTSLAKSILVFGILSLALSEFGIVGLVFAIIAKNRLGRYVPQYGAPTGMAKVGKILSTVGLIASIVYAVVWTVYIIVAIVAILNLAAY